jgi:hypothetical protein
VTKNCTRCGHIKDVSAFAKDRQKKDGLRNWCRDCVRDHRRINAEQINAQRQAYRHDNQETLREKSREYHEANRDEILERKRAYDIEHRDEIAARTAAYYARHPEKKWANTYQNRAKALGLEPIVKDFTVADVIEAYGARCHYCPDGDFEELDHHHPVAAGGAHTLANVRPSSSRCNNAKSHADRIAVQDFRAQLITPTEPQNASNTA